MLAFNPRDPAFIANPYPFYRQLRAAMPVWTDPTGRTFLTKYEDVSLMVRDRRMGRNFKNPDTLIRRFGPTALDEPAVVELSKMMLMQDPPDHTRLRGLVAKVFTARKMEDMRAGIQTITDRLLDKVQAKGEMDAVRDLAFPLPVLVICELRVEYVETHGRMSTRCGLCHRSIHRRCVPVGLLLHWFAASNFVIARRDVASHRNHSVDVVPHPEFLDRHINGFHGDV